MNKLLAIGAIIATILLGVLLVVEQYEPLTDANRQILATSYAEGYCAGQVYWDSQGKGDDALMKTCVDDSSFSNDHDIRAVTYAFCFGLRTKVTIGQSECESIMKAKQFWPLASGALTSSWNKKFPYPLRTLETEGGADRTDDRDTNEREGTGFRP